MTQLELPESVRQYRLISSTDELADFCSKARQAGWFAIDSEFVRERTFYANLGLLQMHAGGDTVIVDPLADINLEPVWSLISSDSIETVLHAGGEDIELFFYESGGAQPSRVFDSQIAAGFFGIGESMGYARLVSELFDNVELDKSLSRTNWLKRPLSPEQLDYAAADASYLAIMYPHLKTLCEEKGCLDIVYEESVLQIRKRTTRIPDDLLYLMVGNAWQLNSEQLTVLQELASWRANKARKKNIPLGFIAKDGALLELARRKPKSQSDLNYIRDLPPLSKKYSGNEMIAVIKSGESKAMAEQPKTLSRLDDMPGYKETFKTIKKKVAELAESMEVPVSLVASRKQINDLINFFWQYSPQQQELLPQPDLITGWRNEAIGAELRAIVSL